MLRQGQYSDINQDIWTPAKISTIVWYDGADLSTISTIDGGVIEWRDKSGNKRHANQFDRLRRPKLKKIGLNGLPCLSFNRGMKNSLRTNKFPVESYKGLYVFTVVKWLTFGVSTDNIQAIIDNTHTGTAAWVVQDRPDLNSQIKNRNNIQTRPLTFPSLLSSSQVGNNIWKQITLIGNRQKSTLSVNGKYNSSADDVSNYNNNRFSLNIGAVGFSSAIIRIADETYRELQGEIAEIIITEKSSNDEVRKIEQYLIKKWGLNKK